MRTLRLWILAWACVMAFGPMELWANPRKMHILWFMHKDHDFWQLCRTIADDAAKDLGIEASFILMPDDIGNHRLAAHKMVNQYLDALQKAPDTDYYLAMIGGTIMIEKILQKARDKAIPVFFYNTKPEVPLTPRSGDFQNVIGALLPDDVKAGYLEAQFLIRAAKARAPDQQVRVIGLGGWSRDVVDTERRAGLEKAIKEEGAVLEQYYYTRWMTDVAKEMIMRSRKVYPQHLVFWTIADYLAVASLDVLKAEKQPFLVGGIDWTKDAFNALLMDHGLAVTVGGHFLDPGWVSVVLYDYHHGRDFKDIHPNFVMDSNMAPLDRETVMRVTNKFPDNNWTRLDFKSFSRVHRQSQTYDFSLEAILK